MPIDFDETKCDSDSNEDINPESPNKDRPRSPEISPRISDDPPTTHASTSEAQNAHRKRRLSIDPSLIQMEKGKKETAHASEKDLKLSTAVEIKDDEKSTPTSSVLATQNKSSPYRPCSSDRLDRKPQAGTIPVKTTISTNEHRIEDFVETAVNINILSERPELNCSSHEKSGQIVSAPEESKRLAGMNMSLEDYVMSPSNRDDIEIYKQVYLADEEEETSGTRENIASSDEKISNVERKSESKVKECRGRKSRRRSNK